MTFTLRSDRLTLKVSAYWMGADLCVLLSGGEGHIGAVVLGIPCAGFAKKIVQGATCSVLTVSGHQDDLPAKKMAEQLAASMYHPVVVVCGIHFDNLTPAEITTVLELTEQATRHLVGYYASNGESFIRNLRKEIETEEGESDLL